MHGYYITCVLKHHTQVNLIYKGFQQFAPKNIFEFVHILAVNLARSMTSQVDMNDNHFLPLDIAIYIHYNSCVVFKRNEIVIDAGLESYPQHRLHRY